MERLEQQFLFEQNYAVLTDRTIFRPLDEAVRRWSQVSVCRSRRGVSFDVIYEVNDGRFVLVQYDDCREENCKSDEPDKPSRLWSGADCASGLVLQPHEAERLIKDANGVVPESLQKARDEEAEQFEQAIARRLEEREEQKEKPVRPLEYWKDVCELTYPCWKSVHELDYGDLARDVYHNAVVLVQVLRDCKSRGGNFLLSDDLMAALYSLYKVDIDHWWGPPDEVPPDFVAIDDLPWPRQYTAVRRYIVQLRESIERPLCCFVARTQNADQIIDSDQLRPHDGEMRAATDKLISLLPRVETATGKLGKELRELVLIGRDQPSETDVDEMPRRAMLALNSYDAAECKLLEAGAEQVTDDDAYAWLEENGPDEYVLPNRENWKRYVREGRRFRQQQKNKPRAGRAGRSVVGTDDVQ